MQLAAPGCEIASIHAVFRGFGQRKFRFGCLGKGIPAVQIDGSGAWILIACAQPDRCVFSRTEDEPTVAALRVVGRPSGT